MNTACSRILAIHVFVDNIFDNIIISISFMLGVLMTYLAIESKNNLGFLSKSVSVASLIQVKKNSFYGSVQMIFWR